MLGKGRIKTARRQLNGDDQKIIEELWRQGVISREIGQKLSPQASPEAVRIMARRLGLPKRGTDFKYMKERCEKRSKPRPEYPLVALSPTLVVEPMVHEELGAETPDPAIKRAEALARQQAAKRAIEARAIANRDEMVLTNVVKIHPVRCWCGQPGAPVICKSHLVALRQLGMRA